MADYFMPFDCDATLGVNSVGLGSLSTGLVLNSYSQSLDAIIESNADIFERSVTGEELRTYKRKRVDDSDLTTATPPAAIVGLPAEASDDTWFPGLDPVAPLPHLDTMYSMAPKLEGSSEQADGFSDQLDTAMTPTAAAYPGCPPEPTPVVTPSSCGTPPLSLQADPSCWPGLAAENMARIHQEDMDASSAKSLQDADWASGTTPKPAAKRARVRRSQALSSTQAPLPFAHDIGTCRVFGPAPGERSPLQKHGIEPADEHGQQLLVTRPTAKNVMYHKGTGVDQCTVDGVTGPPTSPDVEERLELECVGRNATLPGEHPQVAVGDRFMTSPFRKDPLPLGDDTATEGPAMGLNPWWADGKIQFVYGEPPKNTPGKMPKGIARAAVWRLRYSQVRLDSEGKVVDELFAQTIPGLLVLRAESAANKAKNKVNSDAKKVLKRNVIELLKMHGCTQKLRLKQGMGELLTLATQTGVCMAELMDATQLPQHEIEKQVARCH